MKNGLWLALLLLGACGKAALEPSGSEIGYTRNTTPVNAPVATREKIGAICDALEARKSTLPTLVGSDYDFEFATKNCAATELPAGETVTVTLSDVMSTYKFLLKNTSTFFYFQDVETEASGAMAALCSALNANMASPITTNGNFVFFVTENIPNNDCPAQTDEQCIYIERGVASDKQGVATITSRDWIRYRLETAQSRRGFFTYKKNVVQGDCEDEQSIIRQATLK